MRIRNVIKVLPVVFLLTGCNTKESWSRGLPYEKVQKSEQITREEFFNIANTLKNNHCDYNDILWTAKVERVESTGGESKRYLNNLLSQNVSGDDFKFYKLGETIIGDSNRYKYEFVSNYDLLHDSHYYIDNKLICKDTGGWFILDPEKTELISYRYFDENGLTEFEECIFDKTFDDNSELFIYAVINYEWTK